MALSILYPATGPQRACSPRKGLAWLAWLALAWLAWFALAYLACLASPWPGLPLGLARPCQQQQQHARQAKPLRGGIQGKDFPIVQNRHGHVGDKWTPNLDPNPKLE